MRWTAGFVAALVLATGNLAIGQDLPNFSGTWVAVPGASTPKGLPLGAPVTVKQTADSFTIGEDRTYRLDGTETQYQEKTRGRVQVVTAKAAWSGTKLTIVEWRGSLNKTELTYSFDEARRFVVSKTSDSLSETANGLKVLRTTTTRVYQKK